MIKRLGLVRLIALGSALLMVGVGLALCCLFGESGATAATQAAQPAVSPAVPLPTGSGAPPVPSVAGSVGTAQTPTQPSGDGREGVHPPVTPDTAPPSPAAARSKARVSSEASGQVERAASRYPLPPFPAPEFPSSSAAGAVRGPAPETLWLSGVIQGDPKVALLRRGEKRYLVKENGTFESYRVLKISSNSVTIQRGSRKQVLRVGQY